MKLVPSIPTTTIHGVGLGQHLGGGPEEEVGHVDEGLQVHLVTVHDKGSLLEETSGISSDHEVDTVEVGDPASDVEILDGQLSNDHKSEGDSQLTSGGVVGPVEIRLVSGSGDNVVESVSLEPGSKLYHSH